jgi:hypothetical protein
MNWLPDKFDMLIDCAPDARSSRTVALVASWPENRKQEIISRLSENPWLLSVVHQRGWIEDARHEILNLFRRDVAKDVSLAIYVAMLQEPNTYDQLQSTLTHSGNVGLYRALSGIPDFQPRLDAAMHDYFAKVTIHARKPAGETDHYSAADLAYLDAPLIHGMKDAMHDALVLFHARKAEQRGYMREWFAKHFIIPDGIKIDDDKSISFFRDLRIEDIHWDSLARRWRTNFKPISKP